MWKTAKSKIGELSIITTTMSKLIKTVPLVALLVIALAGVYLWQRDDALLVQPLSDINNNNETKSVRLYYYNSALDRDEAGNLMCSRKGLAAVERKIPSTINPIKDTINLLVKGELLNEEKNLGVTTEYPLDGLILKNIVLNNGVLTLSFDDTKNKTVGGACRVGILWFQIEATARQFPEVEKVRFLPEELFQP